MSSSRYSNPKAIAFHSLYWFSFFFFFFFLFLFTTLI